MKTTILLIAANIMAASCGTSTTEPETQINAGKATIWRSEVLNEHEVRLTDEQGETMTLLLENATVLIDEEAIITITKK